MVCQPASLPMKEEFSADEGGLSTPANRGFVRRCLFQFGLASFCYLLGAAALFFDLPTSGFLRRAFDGGVVWCEGQPWYDGPQGTRPGPELHSPLTVGPADQPGKTCDGFTLCLCSGGTRAVLLDMTGKVVHHWDAPFRKVWSEPRYLRIPGKEVSFVDGRVYTNGDLLALAEGPSDARNPSSGYGLVKLDKDSRVLWQYAGLCHHSFDVAADGTIYTLSNEFVEKLPPGFSALPTPSVVDCVEVLSPQGKRLKRIPLLEAFRDSPYAPLLSTLEKPQLFSDLLPADTSRRPLREEMRRRDILHTNAVQVLDKALASKFPQFKAGQLLLSPRHLDTLAVLDPDSGKVVWAAHGPWHGQHDPTFLANGRLLLFDNLGPAAGRSRVLEYDPQTQAFPWSYPGATGKPFYSCIRGGAQRLPNGNTLIVNSEGGEVFEVTPGQEVVWSCSCGRVELNRARRYLPEQLAFLKGVARARP
jgi:hypothetical protein